MYASRMDLKIYKLFQIFEKCISLFYFIAMTGMRYFGNVFSVVRVSKKSIIFYR